MVLARFRLIGLQRPAECRRHAQQGEELLRSLIDNPTVFVSREQATIVLARELARTKPDAARKLLDPLRTSRSAVSQVALQLYGELFQK